MQREGVTMNKGNSAYQVIPYPRLRRMLEITYPSVQRKPMIHGLTEVDVTKARLFLREHRARTGESLSFTAFIVTCFAQALDENKNLHVCRKGSRHLILFDEVDVALPIERTVAGQKQPIIYIIRAANKKTFHAIHREIREAQVEQIEKAWEGLRDFHWLRFVPIWLIHILWWIFCWMRRTYPQVQKRYGGTVGVTTVGMFGQGVGWGIPLNDHTIDLTLGGIASRPAVIEGTIVTREYLCMTLSFDHALIDGAPAASFTGKLKDLIENAYGLDDPAVRPGQATALEVSKKS
jgi:pyruvate/2-oxoglutarate dehydrogenase complex dihydrolipoamide acyltransferase (E2) component